MGTENNDTVVRHLVQFVYEQRATRAQVIHDKAIVNNLVAHIDGCPEHFQGSIDDIDGAIHSGTESARVRQFDLECHTPSQFAILVHIHRLNPMHKHIKEDCTARQRVIEVYGHLCLVETHDHSRHLAAGGIGK